jgi:hypothetical protein
VGKQIAELYAQMRKLTTDVFEQIKGLKTSPQEQQALFDREREALRQQITQLKEDTENRL